MGVPSVGDDEDDSRRRRPGHGRSSRAAGRPVGGRVASPGPLRHPAELPADHRRWHGDQLPQLRRPDAPRDALRQRVRLPLRTRRRRPRRHVLRTLPYLVRVGPGLFLVVCIVICIAVVAFFGYDIFSVDIQNYWKHFT